MPTRDVLLRHFRKMLLYTLGYAVAYSHLLSTLDDRDYGSETKRLMCLMKTQSEPI